MIERQPELNSSGSSFRLYEKGSHNNVATDYKLFDTIFENDSLGHDIIESPNDFSTSDERDTRYIFPESGDVYRVVISWISKFQNQLNSLRKIQNNWNGYGSSAPNSIAIRNSQTFLDTLHILNFSPSSIVPSAEDGIAISFAKGKRRAIVECYNDGNIVAAKYEIDSEPLVWNVGISEEDIKESINQIYDFIQ